MMDHSILNAWIRQTNIQLVYYDIIYHEGTGAVANKIDFRSPVTCSTYYSGSCVLHALFTV
jgi:hypothetical protein